MSSSTFIICFTETRIHIRQWFRDYSDGKFHLHLIILYFLSSIICSLTRYLDNVQIVQFSSKLRSNLTTYYYPPTDQFQSLLAYDINRELTTPDACKLESTLAGAIARVTFTMNHWFIEKTSGETSVASHIPKEAKDRMT